MSSDRSHVLHLAICPAGACTKYLLSTTEDFRYYYRPGYGQAGWGCYRSGKGHHECGGFRQPGSIQHFG